MLDLVEISMKRGLLIGDPIAQSISHITHNYAMSCLSIEGAYSKLQVSKENLTKILPFLKESPLDWLAVTMPLKEIIVPYLNHLRGRAQTLKVVNTILVNNGRWIGENCDGIGAVNAIEKRMSVEKSRVLVIGAGSTAKAIAYELKLRHADISIWNRSENRARELCRELKIPYADQLDSSFDILINATPVGMKGDEMPISASVMKGCALVFDVVYRPLETQFLQVGKSLGAITVSGLEMFLELSAIQLKWALNLSVDQKKLIEMLKTPLLKSL